LNKFESEVPWIKGDLDRFTVTYLTPLDDGVGLFLGGDDIGWIEAAGLHVI